MRKIQRTIGREETISRIPGLFAYLEYSEYGGCVLHTASDSPEGCYGKVVEALEIPVGLFVDDVEIIRTNSVYTYREMMNAYYAYRDDERVGRQHPFIKFVEDGIGQIDLLAYAEKKGVTFDKFPVRAPEYFYLAEIMQLIGEVRKRKRACEISAYADAIGEHDVEMCCLCNEYEEYGGDKMYGLLVGLLDEYVRRSELYRTYAQEGAAHYSLNIPLFGTGKDVGYMDAYTDELTDGNYNKGAYVTVTEVDNEGFYIDMNTYTVKSDDTFETNLCNGEVDGWEEKLKKVEPNMPVDPVNINTETRSRLKSLRNGKQHTDIYGSAIGPLDGEDWLWYYKIGGWYNTRKVDDNNCYVDTIKSVSMKIEKDGNTITDATLRFNYSIGRHIARTCTDGVCTEWAEVDATTGMTFTEDYRVKLTDDWLKLLSNSTISGTGFVEITSGSGDIYKLLTNPDGVDNMINEGSPKYDDTTFPFYTSLNETERERVVGTEVKKDTFISGAYEQTITHSWADEMMASPIFKTDNLSSLVFRPDVHNDIYIQRGDNAAFERHIRLSEIKTIDDLMQYSNGGYYQVEQLT